MERIGRYRAERVLGSGAFGTVWLAHDEALDARVAIKILAENWARDDAFRRRFLDEARILFRADSDHLIRVHTVDELEDGRPYFVMDYADRGSLEERMRDKAAAGGWFRVEEALTVSREIADGLRVVHALGIAHRDLKPANVMYRTVPAHANHPAEERLVLVDFGIARSLETSAATTIATGTPHYMAPEQADGHADQRSDIYSAAVIFYELMSRTVPYPYESVGQIIRAQARGDFAALGSLRGDVTPAIDAVVARGLAVDPDLRYPDAGAWIDALEAAASGERARPSPAAAGAVAAGATMSPEEMRAARAASAAGAASGQPPPPPTPPSGGGGAGAPAPRPKRRRSKLLLTTLVLVAVLAAAIGVIATTGGDEADGPRATEVFAEPISSLGADPFTDDVTPSESAARGVDDRLGGLLAKLGDLPTLTLPSLNLTPSTVASPATTAAAAVPAVNGNTPGLYGGTNLLSVCDVNQLVTFLETNADKARAWADTLGIETGDIRQYASGLTDLILRADTRVTNHSFKNGSATALNAILQAGTAVLVDKFGVPVVRCKCGNPLTPAKPLAVDVKVQGQVWPNFGVGATVTITKGPEVTEFTLGNVLTSEPLYRAPGAAATTATNEPGAPAAPATTVVPETTAPPAPTAPPAGGGDLTSQGAVTASSEFPGGEYPASLGVDGDPGTSWFSAGPQVDGEESTYTWSLPAPAHIGTIEILSNSHNSDASVRENYGFETVLVEVLNSEGRSIYSGVEFLAGTPDPDVTVTPNVEGQTVRLRFTGHEATDCGGFTELRVSSG